MLSANHERNALIPARDPSRRSRQSRMDGRADAAAPHMPGAGAPTHIIPDGDCILNSKLHSRAVNLLRTHVREMWANSGTSALHTSTESI
jgi:hypothetical protein